MHKLWTNVLSQVDMIMGHEPVVMVGQREVVGIVLCGWSEEFRLGGGACGEAQQWRQTVMDTSVRTCSEAKVCIMLPKHLRFVRG